MERERRLQRSPHASQALNFQLSQISRKFDLDGMVLADARGNLWAASQWDPLRSHLASTVATMGVLAAGRDRFTIAQDAGRSVGVKTLRVGEALLYLAAQGAQSRARPALDHAADGVERILEQLI
jgi:C4-dicarboxylate-specific signal transduction histidine kinase